MRKNIYVILMIWMMLFTLIILNGCTQLPDLVAVSPIGLAGFCDTVDSGDVSYYGSDLLVHIKNQGGKLAPSSYVVVDYGNYRNAAKAVPAIPAVSTVSVQLGIPGGCFDSDCGFTIIVDYYDDVKECPSGEINNSQIGNCIG